jgi:ribosomal-protein-alanine N-acetyltransferase
MPAVRVDAVQEADLEAIAAIDAASFKKSQLTVDRLLEELARPWSRLWVAREDGGTVVGFLLTWHVVDELHVLDVATAPERRRQGIGRALMQHAIAFAQANGVRHVMLEVRRGNRVAQQLYRSLSFFALGLRRDYYPDGEDAVEMALMLDPTTRAIVARPDEVTLEPGDAP